MTERSSIKESLLYIFTSIQKNISMAEDELDGLIDKSNFFELLGYSLYGIDIRKQYRVIGNRKKADFVCLDEFQNIIFIMESKKPLDDNLEDALDQLWNRYVLPLKSKYGVLINGKNMIIYERLISGNFNKLHDFKLNQLSDEDCIKIFELLKKPEYDITDYTTLKKYFEVVESYSLEKELSQSYFFEAFKLDSNSAFGNLVNDFLNIFSYLYSESKFLTGAYNYWKRSLANKPEKIPRSWKPFLNDDVDIFKFMFCLETSHALLARLILAKACEDLEFPSINISEFTVNKINTYRDTIPLIGYPIILINLLKEMRDQLIYSIFEEDIFSWWNDSFLKYNDTTSLELMKEDNKILNNFSISVAKIILTLYKFNFTKIVGDPLGDLYQHYFDNETRKALGEFYTPTEIVDYILDGVGYKYVINKRLIDPACGSGTFLVNALKRYLKEADVEAKKKGWALILKDLCNKPKIIGLDIHPFACLIAQVRFMLELMPYYKIAIEEEKLLVFESLQRLPIFRTDSLEKEMIPHEFRKSPLLVITDEDLRFNISLPMQINGDKSVFMQVRLPSWKKLSNDTNFELFNLDEYFCVVQGIFDGIKSIMKVDGIEIHVNVLKNHLKKYLENKDFDLLSNYFKIYADEIINNLVTMSSEFENGRLIKSVEDSILSAILKNYIKYDYVVGNPPYVRVQRLSKDQKDYYKKMYDSPFGKYDLYIVFIERGINWLNESGSLGYILSNMFMKRDYGENIRNIIVSQTNIKQIIDFGVSGVFKDVTNYPCIMLLNKNSKENIIKCIRVAKKYENEKIDITLKHIIDKKSLDMYDDKYIDVFNFDQNKLTSKIWEIMPENEEFVYKKLDKNSIKLKYIRKNIYRAIQTGYDKVYIINKNIIDQNNLERELIKPILKGANNVKRWELNWDDKYMIFPYDIKNGKLNKINIDKYPNIKKYLLNNEEKILKRKWYGQTILESGRQWFELWNPIIFDKPKIVVPEISKTKCFAYDDQYYCAGKVFSIFLKKGYKTDFYYYLLALMNSNVLEFYFKHIASVKQGYYYENMKNILDQLPIKDLSYNEQISKELIVNVKKILSLVEIKMNISNFPTYYINSYSSDDIEFDNIKYTFNKNLKKISPKLIEKNNNIYEIYPEKNNIPIILDTIDKSNYVIETLSKLKTVSTDKPINILIPKLNSIVKRIMKIYKEDNNKLLKNKIKDVEEINNKLISKMYQLNESEIKTIEKYILKYN